MSKRVPIMPDWVIEQINPKPAKHITRTVRLLKYRSQYSMKFPAMIINELCWEAGDKIKMTIEGDKIVLSR